MLIKKTYGIDLGSSTIKVYSFLRNKTYLEKNMIASKGRKIIAVGNEAYDMFENHLLISLLIRRWLLV